MSIDQISYDSELYPTLLREIDNPPDRLFCRGNKELLHETKLLAVVGSRKANHYGKQALEKLLTPAVKAGLPLVSGLAYGIDALAHELCLQHETPTIAVLGSGIDDQSMYPKNHIQLAHRILKNRGLIISEYPLSTPGYPAHFPARNRIIAGLCQATLVVQAKERSGSLITARLALENGRDVYAIPGPVTDPLATGTNRLIQQGATPIINPQDVIDLYHLTSQTDEAATSTFTPEQQTVLAALSSDPLYIDTIIVKTNLDHTVVSTTLIELELCQAVEHVGGMKYVRRA